LTPRRGQGNQPTVPAPTARRPPRTNSKPDVWWTNAETRPGESADGASTDSPTSAEDKLETRRMVDGAKGVLMEQFGMTESDAFGFIQKTAMRTRARMIDVARQVLEGSLVP